MCVLFGPGPGIFRCRVCMFQGLNWLIGKSLSVIVLYVALTMSGPGSGSLVMLQEKSKISRIIQHKQSLNIDYY